MQFQVFEVVKVVWKRKHFFHQIVIDVSICFWTFCLRLQLLILWLWREDGKDFLRGRNTCSEDKMKTDNWNSNNKLVRDVVQSCVSIYSALSPKGLCTHPPPVVSVYLHSRGTNWIWNPDKSGFHMVKKSWAANGLDLEWDLKSFSNPDKWPLLCAKKTHLKSWQKCLDFEWSRLWMVGTKASLD